MVQAASIRLWQKLDKIDTRHCEARVTRTLILLIKRAIFNEYARDKAQTRLLRYTECDLSNPIISEIVSRYAHIGDTDRKELKTWLFHIRTEIDDKRVIMRCQRYLRKRRTRTGMKFCVSGATRRKRPISYLKRLITIDSRTRAVPAFVKRLLASEKR